MTEALHSMLREENSLAAQLQVTQLVIADDLLAKRATVLEYSLAVQLHVSAEGLIRGW